MELPDADRATVAREKITAYLLVPRATNDKAGFFERFGFSVDRWEDFARLLRQHAMSGRVTEICHNPYGATYAVEGMMDTPSGRRIFVRSMWMIDVGSNVPRFTTAMPGTEWE